MDEKLALSPLFRRHVRRPRLTRLLDETTAQAIVLTAPAGYGKTTLAAEWVQRKSEVAWYRATPASEDIAVLSVDLARSLEPLGRFDGRLEERLSMTRLPQDPARSLAEIVATGLSEWPRDAWLVLDDYQSLSTSRTAEEFVDWLLVLSPLRIIVTTRRRPSWVTARRLLHGDVLEIRTESLSMRRDEAAEALKGLPRGSVQRLIELADGWPAVIGLAASVASDSIPHDAVGEVLYTYLAEEVLRQESIAVQEFMLFASLLPVIDPFTCEAILEESSSAEIIEFLGAQGLLHRFARKQHFHPLLKSFLSTKLAEFPERVRVVRQRAVTFFRANEKWDEAFEMLTAAGDLTAAATLLAEAGPDLLRRGRVQTVERWFITCGAAAYASAPRLVRAEALVRRGRFAEAHAAAKEVLAGLDPESPLLFRALYLLGQSAQLSSEYEKAFHYHCQAREHARDEYARRDAVWGAFVAAVELMHPDLDRWLAEIISASSLNLHDRLRREVARFLVSERRGSLAGVWDRIAEVAELASHATDPMLKSNALVNFGCLNAVRGDFATAGRLADEAVSCARSMELDFAVGFGLAIRAEAELGLRDIDAAAKSFKELDVAAADHEDPFLDVVIEILRLKLRITANEDWERDAREDAFSAEVVPSAPYAEYLALRAIMLAALGDASAAKTLSSTAVAMSASAPPRKLAAWADVAADVRSAPDRTPTLASRVERVLMTTYGDDCLGTFVWAYRAAPILLTFIREGTAASRHAASTIRNADDVGLASSLGVQWPLLSDRAGEDILTKREKEVHDLLLRGLSNAEIASCLVISESTAKVHVHRILRKFGMSRRIEVLVSKRDEA